MHDIVDYTNKKENMIVLRSSCYDGKYWWKKLS